MRRFCLASFAAAAIQAGAVPTAVAQTFTWDGGLSHGNFTVNDNWSTANNWVNATPPTSNVNTDVVFTLSGIRTTATQNIVSPFVLHSLTFDAANTNFTSVTGSALDFRSNGSTNPSITQNSGIAVSVANNLTLTSAMTVAGTGAGTLTLGGPISGNGRLTMLGAGTVILSGNNSYAGGTTFAAGTLQAGSANALGAIGDLLFTGGTLQYSAFNTNDYSARFNVAANSAYSIDTNGQNVTFATALFPSNGTLNKLGAGTLTMSAVSPLGGTTTVNGGTLKLAVGNALANSTVTVNANGGLDLNGQATVTLGGLAGTGNIALGATATTLTAGGNNADTSYSGSLTGSATDVVKSGTGGLTLSGTGSSVHSFAVRNGTVTLDGGNIALSSTSAVNAPNRAIEVGGTTTAASLTVQNGATLNMSSATEAIIGLSSASQSMTVQGNGTLWNLPAQTDVGGGGPGTLTVQSGAHLTGGTFIVLGNSGGNGTMQILNGGQVSTGAVFIGFGSATGATNALTVSGANSLLSVGGIQFANFGAPDGGTVAVAAGGSVVVTGDTHFNSNTSFVVVRGGTMTTGSLTNGTGLTPSVSLSDPIGGVALTVGTNNSTTTFDGPISDADLGPGTLAKAGTGTVTLTGPLTNTGGLRANAGTLRLSGNLVQPGTGGLTAAAGATILYDTGARVFGGFLNGPGTHLIGSGGASFSGTTANNGGVITQNNALTLTNFSSAAAITNGAPLTWNGGSNAVGGTLTVNSTASVTGFTSSGVITVNPGATLTNTGTHLVLGGGSRTFVGSAANPGGTIALGGQPLDLNGGLLVNNGTISGGTVNVNFGGLAKGSGTYPTVIVGDSGRFSPGNSPGPVTTGPAMWGAGGTYQWELNDAAGTAGTNWDLWSVNGPLTVASGTTPNSRFTVEVDSLTAGNSPGLALSFDPSHPYTWPIAQATGGVGGFDPSTFTLDTTHFANPINGGTFGLALSSNGQTLSVTFTPVPEPGALPLVGVIVGAGLARRRRRR